jgi:hypothetical protein
MKWRLVHRFRFVSVLKDGISSGFSRKIKTKSKSERQKKTWQYSRHVLWEKEQEKPESLPPEELNVVCFCQSSRIK